MLLILAWNKLRMAWLGGTGSTPKSKPQKTNQPKKTWNRWQSIEGLGYGVTQTPYHLGISDRNQPDNRKNYGLLKRQLEGGGMKWKATAALDGLPQQSFLLLPIGVHSLTTIKNPFTAKSFTCL